MRKSLVLGLAVTGLLAVGADPKAEQFKKHRVEHLFITIKGGTHAWGTVHPKFDPDAKNKKAIMAFLKKHLAAAAREP